MKKLLFLLLVVPFMACSSDDNTEQENKVAQWRVWIQGQWSRGSFPAKGVYVFKGDSVFQYSVVNFDRNYIKLFMKDRFYISADNKLHFSSSYVPFSMPDENSFMLSGGKYTRDTTKYTIVEK